ncbi:MAG: eight-cysteine-cluster domain-containing protein [archaeon]|nr:eight-cysteine-cluster domain-containing protein [archaeon]
MKHIIILLLTAAILTCACTSETTPSGPPPTDPNLQPPPTDPAFCGSSTNGACAVDSDCIIGGCSGQVCQSKNEESVGTTCEYRECYNAKRYGVACKCTQNKCQWTSIQVL